MATQAFVYLIRFIGFLGSPDTHIARYYLGSTCNLKQRLEQHKSGSGAAILRACNEKGIAYKIIKIHVCPSAADARSLERKLKDYKNHAYIANLDWSKVMQKPTAKTIRQQIDAVGGPLKFLAIVRTALKGSEDANSTIADELDELILSQKMLK